MKTCPKCRCEAVDVQQKCQRCGFSFVKLTEAVSTLNTLTDQQVENWRKVLIIQFGPYWAIAPKELVQVMRDKMQRMVNDGLDTTETL